MAQIIYISCTMLLMAFVLFLFGRKAALQWQYLRLKNRKKLPALSDFFRFSWSDARARKERWEAFLLFPVFFPITLDDNNTEMRAIKKRVKSIHIGVYLVLIGLVIMGIYSEKVFPNS